MTRHLITALLVLLASGTAFSQSPVLTTVHFPVNGSELDESSEASLARTLEKLELPYRCYTIEISGHTDADGDIAFNAALSRRRTRSVRDWLRDNGVPETVMVTESQGELAPLASNDSESGKARNRRVEIRFKPDPGGCPKPFDYEVAYQENTFDASEPVEFTYGPSGTRVRVPARALVDAEGNPVTGKVTYQYREWRDPVEFLTSAITMDYPRARSGQHFHSGGMFEIRAYQEGQEVFLAPGRNVDLDFALTDSSQGYDLYAYDPANNGWHAPGEDPFAADADTTDRQRACEEAIFLGEVLDTVAMFVSMIDSGLYYLNGPRTAEGVVNFSTLPGFDECWRNKGYVGVDYVADLSEGEWEKYMGITVRFTPIGKKGKFYRMQIYDSRGIHTELAAVRHLEMVVSELQYRRLPKDLTSKRFGDLRLQARGGNAWRLTLKEPGRFYNLNFYAKDRRRSRPNRKLSAWRDYSLKLNARRSEYENTRINLSLRRAFWEYSKPLMTQGERCMAMNDWLYYFGSRKGEMQSRYNAASMKYKNSPELARELINGYLDSLAWRYENGISALPRPAGIASFWADSTISGFMADLSITGFGIWNCDQIRRIRKPVTVRPMYVDNSGKRLHIHDVSVIDESINGVLTFGGNEFSFSRVAASVFVAISQDGGRYYMDRQMVSKLDLDRVDGIKMVFKPFPEGIDTPGEIRSLLGLNLWGSMGMR